WGADRTSYGVGRARPFYQSGTVSWYTRALAIIQQGTILQKPYLEMTDREHALAQSLRGTERLSPGVKMAALPKPPRPEPPQGSWEEKTTQVLKALKSDGWCVGPP